MKNLNYVIPRLFLTRREFFISLLLTLFVVPSGKTKEAREAEMRQNALNQSNLGAYFWQQGDLLAAIDAWSIEVDIYRSLRLTEKQAEAMLKIAQTYTILGQLSLAIFKLKKVLSLTKQNNVKARAYEVLGNAYSRNGELDIAESAYKKSLKLSKNLSILNNLVGLQQQQVMTAQLKAESAKEGEETEFYQEQERLWSFKADFLAKDALKLSITEESIDSVRALIEWSKVSKTGLSTKQLERGRKILTLFTASRSEIFMLLNWASVDNSRTDHWLNQSAKLASNIEDKVAKSYVFLELGLSAEKSEKYRYAKEFAQKAIASSHSLSVYDALYRSYWLAARIEEKIGNKNAAIRNYRDAIVSFESLNQTRSRINVEQRLNFRTQVEPMYRSVLELLLEEPKRDSLLEALLIFDKFRLAQLQAFFGDNCFGIDTDRQNLLLKMREKNAVVISSIILENQTHFILSLADGTLRHHKVDRKRAEINQLASDWHSSISDSFNWQFWQQGIELYDIIIRPMMQELEQINPATIIFIHDGILRNIPMAALYDGEQFLAEKWASISSIGLNFTLNSVEQLEFQVLAFGLSESRGTWSPLEKVPTEVKDVINIVGGKQFLNKQFTSITFTEQPQKENYLIIHLATHGYFGGVAENSFILAYDKNINALELEDALKKSKAQPKLVVFSACETSLSSDRSVLGLAGVALRSGVDSVLGSFWAVEDNQQQPIIKDFYSKVYQQNFDKAKALQEIQIRQIKGFNHPSVWAALNLIGWDW
ncbi:MAG: CHAT domain-containing protein [Xenococcaceae cyanobacterium MO_207.B15]|nr:CHAT domain-containing protein [Xenococcaceae cyanobacterium MO_207.B15]